MPFIVDFSQVTPELNELILLEPLQYVQVAHAFRLNKIPISLPPRIV